MQCIFHSSSDDPDSCLLDSKRTVCGAIKCLKTIGQNCVRDVHESKLTGEECAKTLVCGCDRKCNGCMTVNGKEICHFSLNCKTPVGKRNMNLMDKQEIFDYPYASSPDSDISS